MVARGMNKAYTFKKKNYAEFWRFVFSLRILTSGYSEDQV